MAVFLSWSGKKSNKAAKFFKDFIEVGMGADVFMSDDGIPVGKGWFEKIRTELTSSDIAIVFITKENVDRPWLNFEIGAFLSKLSEDSRIYPIICEKDLSLFQNHPVQNLQCKNLDWELFSSITSELNKDLGLNRSEKNHTALVNKYRLDFDALLQELVNDFGGKLSENKKKSLDEVINIRLANMENMLMQLARLGSVSDQVAAAIHGQGELATMNFNEVEARILAPLLSRINTIESNVSASLVKLDSNSLESNYEKSVILSTLNRIQQEIIELKSLNKITEGNFNALNNSIFSLNSKLQT